MLTEYSIELGHLTGIRERLRRHEGSYENHRKTAFQIHCFGKRSGRDLLWPSNLAPHTYEKRNKCTQKSLYGIWILTPALFTISPKDWNYLNVHQLKNLDKQMLYIYIMKHYWVIKRNEVWIYTTTWMDLKNIIVKWKNPGTKDHLLYDSVYMKGPE